MALRQLRFDGDPILNKKTKPIKEIDERIRELAFDMIETMVHEQGVGLAAPQIGVLRRICIVCTDYESEPKIMINPEIIAQEGTQVEFEGCLSIPGYRGKVERAAWVKVKYTNLEGEEVIEEGTELLARAFQHEIDHLDGILYTQKAIEIEEITEEEEEHAHDGECSCEACH